MEPHSQRVSDTGRGTRQIYTHSKQIKSAVSRATVSSSTTTGPLSKEEHSGQGSKAGDVDIGS